MNNSRFLVAVMLGLSIAAVGCGDSDTRQAEKRVMDYVDRAERLCGRAQAMLADVLFMVNNKPAPMYEVLKDNETASVTLKPEMVQQLNPKAVAALESARRALGRALTESDAPGSAMALAHQSLARVRMLQGACEEHDANVARANMARTVGRIRGRVPAIRSHLSLHDYIDELTEGERDVVASQLKKMLAGVKAEIDGFQDKVNAEQILKGKQEGIRDTLLKDISRLTSELRALGEKKALAKNDEKIPLLRLIEAKAIEAEKAALRVKKAEDALVGLKASMARLTAYVESAKVRQEMIKTFITDQTAADGDRGRRRKSGDALISAAWGEMVGRLKVLETDWAVLTRAEQAAQVCYDEAASLLKKAQALAGDTHRGASLPAGEGRALMASAHLDLAALPQQRVNAEVAKTVKALWQGIDRRQRRGRGGAGSDTPTPLSAAVDSTLRAIESFAAPTGAAEKDGLLTVMAKRKAAAGKCELAGKAFDAAVEQGDPVLSWVDRGRLAHAKYVYAVNMYAVSSSEISTLDRAKPEHRKALREAKEVMKKSQYALKDGQKAIAHALQGKRRSPNVGALLPVEEELTFGANALVSVKEIDAGGRMVLHEGPTNGTFYKDLVTGRATKDIPGAVYVFDNIEGVDASGNPKTLYAAGDIRLLLADGQYMVPPPGLELTAPAKMTIKNSEYDLGEKFKVATDGRMPLRKAKKAKRRE